MNTQILRNTVNSANSYSDSFNHEVSKTLIILNKYILVICVHNKIKDMKL